MFSTAKLKLLIKKIIRFILPLYFRKKLSIWINNQNRISSLSRCWWSVEIIRDFAEKDINEYHKFLWANHLSYAVTYEVEERFGHENTNESRKLFFTDLRSFLSETGVNASSDIKSVFDVGCSLGYHLRYLETDLFTNANILEGIDIDEYAIKNGIEYLGQHGSIIQLKQADVESLNLVMGDKKYDIIICAGVLMYLCERAATSVVKEMLKHTGKFLAIAGLAHPEIDNQNLIKSDTRNHDRSFIHNIDAMIKKGGGEVLFRRWEGGGMVDGNTIYFVIASNVVKHEKKRETANE